MADGGWRIDSSRFQSAARKPEMRASVNVLSVLHSYCDTPARAKRNRIDLLRVTLKLKRMSAPVEFKNVTAVAKANIYFDGKVVSHTILFPDGSRKTLGLINPGKFHFGTDNAERMEIVAGGCQVKLDGQTAAKDYTAGSAFDVPSKSGFDIEVKGGLCEYVCSFID